MLNKYVKYIFIVLIIILLITYYYPFPISKIIASYTGIFTPETVDLKVNFSSFLSKDFKMDDTNLVNELYSYIENLKVRRVMIPPNSYYIQTPGWYLIRIQSKEGKYLIIVIYNSDYISINGKTYKLTDKMDLKKIYKLILLDQDKEDIDEYYFNIIEEFK
ncbi:hypothetical protein [Maledivibacter halophilus]|uniref:Uncharacterized protein n=1 Tax=Maledivibacter halophilus TaxID=36842 RepID=A0A1T5KQD9_9FIRM|nr:hypothetical protein [Maledivibacter halophilus]SKC65974.1 hypothetical protein SAMN02194393_02058 [Maledivibacter halophilus]